MALNLTRLEQAANRFEDYVQKMQFTAESIRIHPRAATNLRTKCCSTRRYSPATSRHVFEWCLP